MGITVGNTVQVASGSSVNIRPLTDEEWVIHNIYIPLGQTVELYRWNNTGTTPEILMHRLTNTTSFQSYHATINDFFILKNVSGNTIWVSYDGVIV